MEPIYYIFFGIHIFTDINFVISNVLITKVFIPIKTGTITV